VIIDQPNFNIYKQTLIDTDLLYYYRTMHLYRCTTKNIHYTKPPKVDHARLIYEPFLVHLVFANEKACSHHTDQHL